MSEIPIPTPPEINRTARKNRVTLLILVASFILPVVLGDLAYHFGWYKGGQTNKGKLIDPPVSFADFRVTDMVGNALGTEFVGKNWWLLYVVPPECGVACRNRLFQMRQVRRALGKEGDRMRQLLVLTGPLSPETQALLSREFADFAQVKASSVAIDSALQRAAPGASAAGLLYVMDPKGWIMLSYAPESDEKQSVIKAEDILKDLQKLLKASRIG